MGSVNTLNTYKIHNMYFTRCSKDYYDNLVSNKDASTESLSNETVIINKIQENHLYIVVDDSYVDETSGKVGKVDLYLGYTKLNIDTDFSVEFVDGDHYSYSDIHTIREAVVEVIKNLENEADRQDIKIEEIEKRISEEVSSSIHFRGVTTTALTDGADTNPIVVNGESFTAVSGDVVIDNNDAHNKGQEYIFDGTYWRAYGDVSDYVLTSVFNDNIATLNNADKDLSDRITNEENYRTQADDKIREDFVAADEALNTKIINEVIGDVNDSLENKTLNGVINYAKAEDEEINSRIDAINLALSYLADKEVTTLPTISFSSSNVGSVEVGTTISPSYSIKFEDGKYEYGPEPTGSTADIYNVNFNGETKETSSGTFSDITVNDSTSINLTATCNYTEGDIPLNNLGLEYPGGQIASGTTSQISKTLSGFRQVFFGSTTSSFNVDGVSIRNLKNNNVTKSSVSNFTMNIVDGAKQVLISVPNNRKITAIEDKNAFGTDILAKFATSTLKVAGADENINSEYARDYTVYIYSPDAALSSNTYTVRLANA